jgi:hypothetical protein
MKMKQFVILFVVCLTVLNGRVTWAQNWSFSIYDAISGSPVGQVNGVTGGQAIIYATILNYTGTSLSDNGAGGLAPSTPLDFMGLGWTLQTGQDNLESFFVPDPQIPGFPMVPGSPNSSLPGGVFSIPIGFFDFTASAIPTDINSTIPFGDINGTMRLNVTTIITAPEPATLWLVGLGIILIQKRLRVLTNRRRYSQKI